MTVLLDCILRKIALEGPMSIAEYMTLALGHPEHGYYASRDPFGVSGDFITAPEISQIFGELIGLWSAQVWMDLGQPERVHLVELGPGRGTLMADALRATRIVPGFHDALDIRLVETSPSLLARQKETLRGAASPTSWHDTTAKALSRLEGSVIILGNEFFDAMPIHQFVRTETGWHERMIGIDPAGALTFVVAPEPVPVVLPFPGETAPLGAIAELRRADEAIMSTIAEAVAAQSGAALIIDYGHLTGGPGDTFQAMRFHKYCPVLKYPGEADLTAHVNFEALAKAAAAASNTTYGPIDQRTFLTGLGLMERAERLRQSGTEEQVNHIDSAVRRLTSPQEMGSLFKVLGCAGPDQPALPGFPPDSLTDLSSAS